MLTDELNDKNWVRSWNNSTMCELTVANVTADVWSDVIDMLWVGTHVSLEPADREMFRPEKPSSNFIFISSSCLNVAMWRKTPRIALDTSPTQACAVLACTVLDATVSTLTKWSAAKLSRRTGPWARMSLTTSNLNETDKSLKYPIKQVIADGLNK